MINNLAKDDNVHPCIKQLVADEVNKLNISCCKNFQGNPKHTSFLNTVYILVLTSTISTI